MADYQLSGVVTLRDQTRQGTESAARNIGGLEDAISKAKAALAAFGAVEAVKAIVKLGELGAKAERTEAGFRTISGGAAEAALNLKAMLRATEGAVDRTSAMAVANQMLQMGLATNADELERNATLAVRLGRAMGVDALTAMQNWNAMMANQSIPRLDTFGISSGRVRTRINELMSSIEGLTREQAFNMAVMEEGEKALARLGDATVDNALKIEQSKAAWADLKNEIGMVFAGAVGDSERGIGRLTRAFADHLAATREMRGEYNLLELNVGTFFEVLGFNNTIYDQHRAKQDAINAGLAAAAQAYNDVGVKAASIVEPINDFTAAQDDANRAAAEAAIAFYDAAAGLQEMSEATLVKTQLDLLKKSMDEGRISTDEYVAAQHALLTKFGLLTPAEEKAQAALDSLRKAYEEGKLSADAYALAVATIKGNIDALESKTITIDVKYNAQPIGPEGKGADIPYMAMGGTSLGGWHWVGERGPELAYLQPGSRVVEHNQSTHIANTYNVYPATGAAAAYLINEARRQAAGG